MCAIGKIMRIVIKIEETKLVTSSNALIGLSCSVQLHQFLSSAFPLRLSNAISGK